MTRLDKELIQQPEIVTISLGTLFSYVYEGVLTNKVGVVMGLGKIDTFDGAFLHEEDGKKYLGTPGTKGGDQFGVILGQMTPNEVIEAVRLGKEKMHLKFTQEDLDFINDQVSKSPRKMPLINKEYQRPKELINIL